MFNESHLITIFVGDLGGYLGLCFGASLLSLLEVMEFACMGLYSLCYKKNAAVKKVHVQPDNTNITKVAF